jgi:hypothetical protein
LCDPGDPRDRKQCGICASKRDPPAAGTALVLLAILALAACGYEPPKPVPQAYLFEKGSYQRIYGPHDRIIRVLYGRNANGKADMLTLF